MGIKKFIERKHAEKELGKGWFLDEKTNYKHYVNDTIRTISSHYNFKTDCEQRNITKIIKACRQAKTDVQTAMFGKYLSLMLTGMTVASLSESELNYVYAGLFGASAILMQVFQVKSSRELNKSRKKLKEAFGLDDLSQSVYVKTTSEKTGRRLLPFGSYISDKTCQTCIDDACDGIIERGFSR